MTSRYAIIVLLCAAQILAFARAGEIPGNPGGTKEGKSPADDAKADYKANEMLTKGLELIDQPQSEERAVKILQSIPQMYPRSRIRFKAWNALGQYYMKKRNYDLAIKQFEQMNISESEDEQAEGLYRLGICHFLMNNYDKAFMALRKVTNQFPWSVFANEAYYYIGQCHFKLNRWANAVEALEMVGTSVPLTAEGETVAEAGQRLFVKIHDKDLVVLLKSGEKLKVQISTKSGDQEELLCEPLGKSGEYFIGSIQTQPGQIKAGDGVLQIKGGDTALVTYVDANTEDQNQRNVKRLATVRMVSTASLGFTDGAYREYTKGVVGGAECFVRLKDLDQDVSDKPDTVIVRLLSQYKEKRERDLEKGVLLDEPEEEIKQRDAIDLQLVEIDPKEGRPTGHSGLFGGTTRVVMATEAAQINQSDNTLSAMQGDEIVAIYLDEANISGSSRELKASARILNDRLADVEKQTREVTDLDKKAQKLNIEANIYLRLGQIFKDVGLNAKAYEKADIGLASVEDVLRLSLKASLSREIVEEAYSLKWELLLVKDNLSEAISVCHTLTQRFPDSALVDKALLKIGEAKMMAKEYEGAIQVFAGILRLPKSELKAEAQFNIARIEEERLLEAAKRSNRPAQLASAMLAYKKVADTYPDSPFAGEALDKIANYYIQVGDYSRAIELMQQVFQDYEDAKFLDRMLLKWVIAAYRSGQFAMAKEKLDELLSRYPGSAAAEKGREYQAVIEKKLGGGSSGGGGEE